MKSSLILTVLLTAAFLCSSCKEDSTVYPPVLTEFVNLQTDHSGNIHMLLTDEGSTFTISHATNDRKLVPDSTYRVVALYEIQETQTPTAYLYDFTYAFSKMPLTIWKDELKQDPVKIQSIWTKGDYLNLILLIKAQNQPHVFHFIETDKHPIVRLQLYHDKGSDIEAYTQRAYLSVPLQHYKSDNNEIQFTINTDQGIKTYSFPL